MIHFALRCPDGHSFDGWFRSNADFEDQIERGLVSCATCGSYNVQKALMRPALGSTGSTSMSKNAETRAGDELADPAQSSEVVSAASPDDEQRAVKIREVWSAIQDQARALRAKSDYVGPRFAEEARKIHYGETGARSVFGEASKEEVLDLREEGILALPLPALPEDQN